MNIFPINNVSFHSINYYEIDARTGEANFFYEKQNPDFIKRNKNLGKRYSNIMKRIKDIQEEIFDIEYTISYYKISKILYIDMQERLIELGKEMEKLKKEKQQIDNIIPDLSCLGDKVESLWVVNEKSLQQPTLRGNLRYEN